MAICTIALQIAGAFPPLSFLFILEQYCQFFTQQAVRFLHLTQFKLPARTAGGL